MNAPETLEGEQVWRLALRCGGQVRTAGMGGVLGLDMTAVLALGAASGIEPVITAELMPAIEAVMVRKLRERNDD
ncbi:hypothetical protein V8J36_05295 [Frigidibacter sp. MR17.14]|uniref:DUF7697 family protein n=1 Tax=Frigidibacter sp. MR17.14 TaxID=3126509 RepID=UPI003012E24A